MDETGLIDDWLRGLLIGDTAFSAVCGPRVFPDLAPPNTATPYAVYSVMGGNDVLSAGQTRITSRPLYMVRLYGKSGQAELRAAAGRVDALLHGQNAVVSAVGVKCARSGPWRRSAETVNNVRIDSRMAAFRVIVQPDN